MADATLPCKVEVFGSQEQTGYATLPCRVGITGFREATLPCRVGITGFREATLPCTLKVRRPERKSLHTTLPIRVGVMVDESTSMRYIPCYVRVDTGEMVEYDLTLEGEIIQDIRDDGELKVKIRDVEYA